MRIEQVTKLCMLFLLACLLTACGGSGGGGNAAVLAGDPAQSASTALQDKQSARVDKSDIIKGHLLTRLFVVFKADATVGQVNAAAQAAGASKIAFSSSKLPMLTLHVPRQAGIGEMHALAKRVREQPGVFFAWPAREFKASVLPELTPGQPVSPLDLSHLLPTRFPQAWNARGAAATDCLTRSVPVYVLDKFGDSGSRPTFFSQIDSNGFVFDDVGASADVSGHGFDVVSTLGAAFDAQKPTGANPFDDCLVIHQIDAFGRDMFETTLRARDAVLSETESRFIFNSSLNFADDFCGPHFDQVCDAATIRTTDITALRNGIELRVLQAFAWAVLIGPTDLGQRMLITQTAGNVDPEPNGFLARNYRGFRLASFSSPAALATRLGELSTLLRDPVLWFNEADPTLPDLEIPDGEVTLLIERLAQGGVSNSLSAQNLLLVGSVTDAEVFADHQSSAFNFVGANLSAVGENIKLFDVPLVTGTSFAAPQVAGLASYLWVLSDPLRNAPVASTVDQIRFTSRASANSVPVIDAYAAILSLDNVHLALLGPDRIIRKALLDVNGDGAFDHLDLLKFQEAYLLTDPNRPSIPSSRDYSRFDLNGDGFTGGIIFQPFDLDISPTAAPNSVTLPIEGFDITFNEAALSDIQILCHYAYSDLYATSPVNRAEALLERTRILGADHCVGARLNALLPAQISESASLNVTVEVPAANGQFAPAPNMLVSFTPTCGTVSPTSGRTNASGAISTTVTPGAGCANTSVNVVARADVNTQPLAQRVVTASVTATIAAPPLLLAAGLSHTCALLVDGTVGCWGDNFDGQLGFSTLSTFSSIPAPVSGLTGVTAIAAGSRHNCALLGDGTVRCWGSNNVGQLGNGTTTASVTPVQVSGLTGATAIVAAGNNTCALANGTVRCWGSNEFGQLGNGTTTNSSIPVTVSGVTGATDIAVGGRHACALLADGTARCWGDTYIPPVTVSDLLTEGRFLDIAAAGSRTCAVNPNGSLVCWTAPAVSVTERGGGLFTGLTALTGGAQICLFAGGTLSECIGNPPADLAGVAGITSIGLGFNHTCAISGGTALCWGSNFSGQLGDGTTTASSTPVRVSGFP